MPGDELHDEGAAAGARSGPKHAAPKKPLLNRLHVPAGKAIAIAAMPSAVLMGMGLTPTLAVAKPKPDSPFLDGPCVTAQDRAEEERAEKEKAEREKAEAAAKKKAEQRKAEEEAREKEEAERSEDPDASPSPSPGASDEPDGSGGLLEPEPSDSSGSTDSGDDGGGLLGGLGDTLDGALTPDEEESAEPTAEPSPSSSPSEESGTADSTEEDAAKEDATDPVKDTVDGVTQPVEGVLGGAKDAQDRLQDTVPATGALVEDDKERYPCVTERRTKGTDENTPVTIPDDPWILESTSVTLRGLDYQGVVNVTTHSGEKKQALKFTADNVDIDDLHQIVKGPQGKRYHVQARKGSTSTMRGGTVTMYTERLQGNLFGLIPVVFDPEHPPPLNVPHANFTNVKITQAGQFGGNLTVPGMRVTITD